VKTNNTGSIQACSCTQIAQDSTVPPVVLWNRLTVDCVRRQLPATGAVVVRRAHGAATSDLAAVRAIAEACGWAGGSGGKRFAAAGIVAELRSRPGRLVQAWLATVDAVGPPVGLVTLVVAGPPPGRCSIGWLLVHPSARRHGVATALVLRAFERAWALGHDRVCVETLPSWTDAVAFWHAMGFVAQA
jgi:GNAT superfamily N-acetyltransferase